MNKEIELNDTSLLGVEGVSVIIGQIVYRPDPTLDDEIPGKKAGDILYTASVLLENGERSAFILNAKQEKAFLKLMS